MACYLYYFWCISLQLFGIIFLAIFAARHEICNNQEFAGSCPDQEAILMESAFYGRMRLGQCVNVDLGYLGCQNDVLGLADRWCSGRRECTVPVSNNDLDQANTECVELTSYLELDYRCVQVQQPSSCRSPLMINAGFGEHYLSSHVTDQTGCGSANAPWVIQANPGQTIQLDLLDFGALQRQSGSLHSSCQEVYGYILERSLGVNMTICGGKERRQLLYTTKTDKAEIHITRKNAADRAGFMIQYQFVGCSDLTPPAEAWYKREGSEAVIGCKSNDRVWRLHCHGNTWDGVVGNCSSKENTQSRKDLDFSFSSVIFLTGVVCAAFLLVIVVVVAGSVYIKKQSIKHDIKLRSDYATLPRTDYTTARKPGYDTATLGTATIPVQAVNQRTWDASLLPSVTTRGSEPLGHLVQQSGGSNSRDLLQ